MHVLKVCILCLFIHMYHYARVYMYNNLYTMLHDEESKLTIGNVNVGSMSGREGEVIDMIKRRGIDICCLQETRWTGIGENEIGGYKCIYMGGTKGVSGVGVVVSPEWESNIVNMTRVSARI